MTFVLYLLESMKSSNDESINSLTDRSPMSIPLLIPIIYEAV